VLARSEPVLVVGGGPVGLVSALLLARWGIASIVLEAAVQAEPGGSRAICFQRDVLDILDRLGCAEEMIAEGVTWTKGRTFYRDRELVTITFPDPGASPVPPWINISQTSVERMLLARAAAEPLIDLRRGHRVTAITDDPGAPRVEVSAERADGPDVTIGGSHLIGADGPRSTVRDLIGAGFPGRSYPDQFLICDISADLPFGSERRFYFDPAWNPGRQVLVHQCPAGTWRIDWQVPADFDFAAERASGGLDARVSQVTGGRPFQIAWASSYRFAERVASAFSTGRTFLAGDSAHLYAPFGARGLNSGIQDAENLAWKLAFVRHGWAPGKLLDSYHAERAAAAEENLRVTSATMEFLVPQSSQARRRRAEALDRALTDPAAGSLINSGKLAEPYWYLTSPLTTPAPALASAPAGFPSDPGVLRPPVPGVICPDGPCVADGSTTRLRRLLGHSLVILTRRPAAAEAARATAAWAVSCPVSAWPLDEIDPTGALARALNGTEDSVHLVRPDAHLAAVLPCGDPAALTAALRHATAAG
jgi:2-polyprenyl-6-methoxyphenol hydroxylase-like FAD-dependent oxidoreductase